MKTNLTRKGIEHSQMLDRAAKNRRQAAKNQREALGKLEALRLDLDKKDAWITRAASDLDFMPDLGLLSEEMDRCDFEFTHSGVETGRHEPGSDGWNECVMDYWHGRMDYSNKADFIVKHWKWDE